MSNEKIKYKSYSINKLFFIDLIADLLEARKSISIEMYIFRIDELGSEIKDILIEKIKAGVKVSMFLDGIGSWEATELFFGEYLLAGGELKFFRRPLGAIRFRDKLNSRNHRKVIIIDGQISYFGSANIDKNTEDWKEFTVRINDMHIAGKLNEISHALKNCKQDININQKIIYHKNLNIVPGSPGRRGSQILYKAIELMDMAKDQIIIETPYTIVDSKIFSAIKAAINRGVDVKIITPIKADHYITDALNKRFLIKLKKIRADVYHYPGMLHSKMLSIDGGDHWMFGTYNFDYRSSYFQYELMLEGNENHPFSNLIINHLQNSISEGIRVKKRDLKNISIIKRVTGRIFYVFKYLL